MINLTQGVQKTALNVLWVDEVYIMRYCTKTEEPPFYTQWRKNYKLSALSWSDFSQPQSRHNRTYKNLKTTLLKQQSHTCCYCEIALKYEHKAHVEHLKDKANYPQETFNFSNLLVSCIYYDSCGHKKGSGYFKKMVSPMDKDCQKRFTYTARGKTIPKDEADGSAQKTIDLLGLNCKRLVDRRLSIIKNLQNIELEYLQKSLESCVEWYDGFYTLIEYLLKKQKEADNNASLKGEQPCSP